MIQLTSFYPLSNFLRVTQEFGDEKIAIKNKSHATEYQFEISYEQISKIRYTLSSNSSQMILGIFIAAIACSILILSNIFNVRLLQSNVFVRLEQTAYIIGILVLILGAIKKEYCQLFDKNGNFITEIRINSKNEEDIDKAIDLVKSKVNAVDVTDPDDPFPNANYLFEYISRDIADYISKSTTRFYETELVDYEKSLIDERVTRVKYEELGERIIRGKQRNSRWGNIGILLIFLGGILFQFMYVFYFTKQIYEVEFPILRLISWIIMGSGFLAFFIGLIKEESIVFFNHKNQYIYSVQIARANKKKAELILEFIRSKISSQDQ